MTMNESTEPKQSKCYHDNLEALVEQYWNDEKLRSSMDSLGDLCCPDCGRKIQEINMDPNDIDPTSRVSEQPHGQNTYYCGQHGYVKPDTWQGETVCPYHQRVHHGEEGPEFYYDEFNQDGEEW